MVFKSFQYYIFRIGKSVDYPVRSCRFEFVFVAVAALEHAYAFHSHTVRPVYIEAPVPDHDGVREVLYAEPLCSAGDYNGLVRVRLAEGCAGDEVKQLGYAEMLQNAVDKKLGL